MNLVSKFLGKKENDHGKVVPLAANPKIEKALSLQMLYDRPITLDSSQLQKTLASYHSSMSQVRCEMDERVRQDGNVHGLVGWGNHVIRLVGFNLPMPADAVEICIAPSHYPQELKTRARAHSSHLLLYYVGYDESAYEQYVALAAVAGALAPLGAIVVLNESAHTSFPANALERANAKDDMLTLLRTLPLLILYCGFVKYDIEGRQGVWMRTFGAPVLDLPNLAGHAVGHQEGQKYFDLFENILGYLRSSDARLGSGHTMQVGKDEFLRFRTPTPDEYFLADDDEMLVVEMIRQQEINKG